MSHFLQHYELLGIFAFCFVSAVGIPVGAEFALIYGGVLASGQVSGGPFSSVVLVIVVALVAEVSGSLVGYAIGMYGGRPLVDKVGKYILVTHKDLDRAEAWFSRHGDPLVFFGRLVPLVRSFVSLAAGLAEMARAKFILYTTLGIGIWITFLAILGDSLGSSYEKASKTISDLGYIVGAVIVIAVVVLFWHRWRTVRAEHRGQNHD